MCMGYESKEEESCRRGSAVKIRSTKPKDPKIEWDEERARARAKDRSETCEINCFGKYAGLIQEG